MKNVLFKIVNLKKSTPYKNDIPKPHDALVRVL